jgi:hypothetical protein
MSIRTIILPSILTEIHRNRNEIFTKSLFKQICSQFLWNLWRASPPLPIVGCSNDEKFSSFTNANNNFLAFIQSIFILFFAFKKLILMGKLGLLLQCLRTASLKTKRKSITPVVKVSKPLKKLKDWKKLQSW